MKHRFLAGMTSLIVLVGSSLLVHAQDTKVEIKPLKEAYFGELHLHAAYSLDAYGFGNQAVGPDEAYRFAKGETVPLPGGGTTRISAPLDFASVTEHSEWLGEAYMIRTASDPMYNHDFARAARASDESFFKTILAAEDSGVRPQDFSGEDGATALAAARSVWQEIIAIADRHNDPGTFSTLHGFEWTAAPQGNNLHRNVIFRSDNLPELPISWFEARTVEELWDWLETTGGGQDNVLAIPHNSNMSGGLMFRPEYSDGRAMDADYARRRAINEPLFEMMQAKGNSETHPGFAPNDEFAAFELVPLVNFVGPVENSPYMWVREALKAGLGHEARLGTNPFRFGIVGGTDQHNGLTGDTDEFDFHGSHGLGDAEAKTRLTASMEVFNLTALNPGGLTGVWAEANTRETLWDGLRRKETFGTSGVRIRVRFFGGFHYKEEMASHEAMVEQGYALGVPMGGSLPRSSRTKPTFMVWALKDPQSGNLDRIQIIKGWQDAEGNAQEKVIDVVWSGDRSLNGDGKLPPVGNTVDVGEASYTNSIGAAQLSGFWSDPDFDPDQRAFYYARVLEIPTPRWSTYDAVATGMDVPEDVPASVQERAWTSAIWYDPFE